MADLGESIGGATGGAMTGGVIGGPLGAAIGGGLGFMGGLFGSNSTNSANKKIAQMNIDFQRETNEKNEALMREQWGREDNAVQRRAKDLAQAGMSPLLAAGSAANAGNVVAMTAPQSRQVVQQSGLAGAVSGIYQGLMTQQSYMDMIAKQQQVLINQGQLAINREKQFNDTQLASKEAGIKEMTMKSMILDNKMKEVGLKYADRSKLLQYMQQLLDYDISEYNLGMSKKYGLRTTETGNTITKTAQQLDQAISNIANEIFGKGGK